MNVVLIGCRSSGKTTIAKILAERLALTFLDLDQEIEKQAERTIPEIFEAFGEEGFRKLEIESVRSLVGKGQTVVATGGGVVTNLDSIPILREFGAVFYLHVEPETLIERRYAAEAEWGNRPALTDSDAETEIHEIYGARDPLYRSTAHHVIENSDLSAEEAADRIEERLRGQV